MLTRKAKEEVSSSRFISDEVIESIVNAPRIEKTLRSSAAGRSERLYVLKGKTFGNLLVYTKGKIVRDAGEEMFYILISSKRAT